MRSHAPFEPIVTKFYTWGRVVDMITDAKFYGNQLRRFRVTGLPKHHFLNLTLIALTTVSALPCCTLIKHMQTEVNIVNRYTLFCTTGFLVLYFLSAF